MRVSSRYYYGEFDDMESIGSFQAYALKRITPQNWDQRA